MPPIERCAKHPFERAETFCRRCGWGYCDNCLVRPRGGSGPYCIACAVAAGGVRETAAAPPACSPKEIRRMIKEEKKALKAAQQGPGRGSRGRKLPDFGEQPVAARQDLAPGVIPAPAPGSTPVPARVNRPTAS